ncbi:hypothetical protein BMF94_5517 [Rhodotorula taiwanensis]|uniref:Enoyl reductase (ER) domain-containing protein n=1 Tax=Rhodotorula taiwanensis TaxID=741276 RepID=A0A2S5B376_9BASI|nr:hypothetical protein BMF94_5517 [Rhodotorula taiwanensis]
MEKSDPAKSTALPAMASCCWVRMVYSRGSVDLPCCLQVVRVHSSCVECGDGCAEVIEAGVRKRRSAESETQRRAGTRVASPSPSSQTVSYRAATMKAVVVPSKGQTELKDVPTPEPAAGQVVVKTLAIALNPTDWKHRDFLAPPGSWLGCDFSGTVDKVGDGVDNLKQGDRVAGFVHGGQWEGEGSFAEYVKAEANLVWRVPDSLSDEQAAAAGGVGPWTAIQALYMRLGLATPSSPSKEGEPVLIWGGSTSVGLYALQFLKAGGYTPVSVSSKKSYDLVKKFGAAATFDYNDPEVSAKIAKEFPSLQYGLDCISEGKTTVSIVKAIKGAKGTGRVITLLLNKDSEIKDVAGDNIKVEMTLAYTTLGVEFDWPGMTFPAMPEHKSRMEDWCAKGLPQVFESGAVKPNPIHSMSGGLENITEGLEYVKAGKNRGVKVTYKV